jgi:hypothetical protein
MDGLKNLRRAAVAGRRQRKRSGRPEPAKPYLDALSQPALLSVDVLSLTDVQRSAFAHTYSATPAPLTGLETANKLGASKIMKRSTTIARKTYKEGDGTAAHCQPITAKPRL